MKYGQKIPFFFIISLLLLPLLSIGQNKTRVLNKMTGFPIETVALYSLDQKRSALTDKDGYFDLTQFLENDTLHMQHPAFIYRKITVAQIYDQSFEVYMDPEIFLLNEFVITASNVRQNAEDLPNKIAYISSEDIQLSNSVNGADILNATGDVIVQKTQGGGGSPILRGFEANRILLVVDGIRMNNAIYRSGHLQNSVTVDPAVLKQVDVIFGPTSIAYGSDALGGVIHYRTVSPETSDTDTLLVRAKGYTQYATATNTLTQHLNLNIGGEKLASFSAFTHSKFGDITSGGWRNPKTEDDYGLVHDYVARSKGKDVTLENKNPNQQISTGYTQYDLMQKFKYVPSTKLELEANFQYSTSSDVDRLDKLMDYSGEDLKYAEYGYGPQSRFLGSVNSLYKRQSLLYTNFKTILAYQHVDEDRYSRKFNNESKLWQREDVDIWSLNVDFLKIIHESNKLNYGVEYTYNNVKSKGEYLNILDGNITRAISRYPDGGSKTYNASAYATYNWLIHPGYLFNAGVRYSHSILKSEFTDEYEVKLPYPSVKIVDGAPTANLSFVLTPIDTWQFNLLASSGFRAPNVDDYGKVRAKKGDVTVPNNELRSEFAYNVELGIKKKLTDEISINLTGFHTWLKDAIVRQDYSINGKTELEYDGDMYKIVTNLNASEAIVRGISAAVEGVWKWGEFSTLNLKGTLNYTEGFNSVTKKPLGHIPPVFGKVDVKFSDDKWQWALSCFYNGDKLFGDMSPYGEDNEDMASELYGGFPAWWTLNFRTSYLLNENARIQLGVDNLLDVHYRPFASAVAAPGRNFVFGLFVDF